TLAPDNPDAHYRLGVLLLRRENPAGALTHFDRALQLDAAFAECHVARSTALASLNRHSEALDGLDAALRLAPDNIEALTNRASPLTVRDPDLWSHRAKALANLNRFAEAAQDCEKALALDPSHIAAQRLAIHARLHACDWTRRDADEKDVVSALAAGIRIIDPL